MKLMFINLCGAQHKLIYAEFTIMRSRRRAISAEHLIADN
jgi:hypothetical protein